MNQQVWVVGDVHGRLHTLKKLLSLLPDGDEVVCTGDLIDRGVHSAEVVRFVRDTDGVSSVLGNHDDFVVMGDTYLHLANNGHWYYRLPQEEQDELKTYLKTLPISKLISVGDKDAVVTHAPMISASRLDMLWNIHMTGPLVPKFNVFGHVIVKEPVITDDRVAIDTGMERLSAVSWPGLEIVSVDTLKEDVDPLMWDWIEGRKHDNK